MANSEFLPRDLELSRRQAGELIRAALAGDDGTVDRADERSRVARHSLHLACAVADIEAVEQSTTPVDTLSGPLHATPLVYLCASRYGQGRRDCAERRVRIATILLDRGADPNTSYTDIEHFDGTRLALSAAAKYVGSAKLLETLVRAGANGHDHSALWATVRLSHPVDDDRLACLRYLLSLEPALWILNTALSIAVRRNDPEAASLLLDAGASPNSGGGWGGSGTLLHHAVLLDVDEALLERLLRTGDRKRQNREGRTPLQLARQIGHRRAQELLLDLGETAPEPTPAERAIAAALAGDEEELAALDALGPDSRTFQRGEHQILTWALRHGRADAIGSLLRIGLDPNITDDDGRSALLVAREAGCNDAADRLLAAGGTIRSHSENLAPEDGFAVFEEAAQALVDGDSAHLTQLLDEHEDLIRWRSRRPHRATLLHYIGANGIETERQKTPPNAVAILELLLSRGAEPDALCASYGGGPAQTTLALLSSSSWPAKAGLQGDLVRALCAGGADPNGVDDDGVPLATAIGFSCGDAMHGLIDSGARVDNPVFAAAVGDVDLIERMVGPGGAVRPGTPVCTVDWFTPSRDPVTVAGQALVVAARFDQPQVVRRLLELGVDPAIAPTNGETALHTASYNGNVEVVQTLLEFGADPHLRDSNHGSTSFGWALEGKHTAVIEVLREHTLPCLTDAVDIGLVEETRQHLERDPTQVDAPDGKGGLLLWSAYQGRTEMVALLLEFGAKRDVRNSQGMTPADLAAHHGHREVVRLFFRGMRDDKLSDSG